jgi:hypothetical protein
MRCGHRMPGDRRPLRSAAFAAASVALTACAGHHSGLGGRNGEDEGIRAYPANYKSEILAAMHAYLNDPTGIRDAAISEPMLKSIGSGTRYVVCLRFNAKPDNGANGGDKQIGAQFLAGRFDDFLDATASRQPCVGAAYAPFPELEQLKP